MIVVGMSYTTNAETGMRNTTLYVTDDFEPYFSSEDGKRGCMGVCTEKIYVGSVDCKNIKLGCRIDISYDKAVTLRNGNTFQPVKRVDVIENK